VSIIRGPRQQSSTSSKDEITPHVGPCFRCLHTRTLAHPVRVAAGYPASPRRHRLCAACPAGLAPPRLREHQRALHRLHRIHRARNAWPACLGPRNAGLCARCGVRLSPGIARFASCACIIFASLVGRPLSHASEQGPLRLLNLRQFPSHGATVDAPARLLQSVRRTARGRERVHAPAATYPLASHRGPTAAATGRAEADLWRADLPPHAQSCLRVVPDGRRTMEQKKQNTDTTVHGCETREKAVPPSTRRITQWPAIRSIFHAHLCQPYRTFSRMAQSADRVTAAFKFGSERQRPA
jgi:hypothetical protein